MHVWCCRTKYLGCYSRFHLILQQMDLKAVVVLGLGKWGICPGPSQNNEDQIKKKGLHLRIGPNWVKYLQNFQKFLRKSFCVSTKLSMDCFLPRPPPPKHKATTVSKVGLLMFGVVGIWAMKHGQ